MKLKFFLLATGIVFFNINLMQCLEKTVAHKPQSSREYLAQVDWTQQVRQAVKELEQLEQDETRAERKRLNKQLSNMNYADRVARAAQELELIEQKQQRITEREKLRNVNWTAQVAQAVAELERMGQEQ